MEKDHLRMNVAQNPKEQQLFFREDVPNCLVSHIDVPHGTCMDYSYAQNLASTPFTRICSEFEI